MCSEDLKRSEEQEPECARISELIRLHNEMEKLDQEILDWKRMRMKKAIRSGELLIEQKASLKHGEWIPWFNANIGHLYDLRTANRYMKLYSNMDKFDNLSNFGLSEAYCQLTDPRERGDDLIEGLDDLEYMGDQLQDEKKEKPRNRRQEKNKENPRPEPELNSPGSSDKNPSNGDDDYEPALFESLAEKGPWGDVTLKQVIESVKLAAHPKVPNQHRRADRFRSRMEEIKATEVVAQIIEAYEELTDENRLWREPGAGQQPRAGTCDEGLGVEVFSDLPQISLLRPQTGSRNNHSDVTK